MGAANRRAATRQDARRVYICNSRSNTCSTSSGQVSKHAIALYTRHVTLTRGMYQYSRFCVCMHCRCGGDGRYLS